MKRKNVINVVNFIRGADNRVSGEVLLDTFRRQLELSRESGLPSTVLLQYDAMVQPAYRAAIAELPDDGRELGVWIEFCRKLVESCGLEWHGRPGFEWDWYVDPDMSMAYPPAARKKLMDAVMGKFYELFGYYPKSVGSWLIDSVSLEYLAEKYGIDAACICKEQLGTDGYTLWGGYYSQGYYPARKNMLSTAQSQEEQIGVPVFRMLGTDPIDQYYGGLDEDFGFAEAQNVYTLEPAGGCGQDPKWVDWFLDCNFKAEALSFAYVQVGQENSFTWETFGASLIMQMEKVKAGHLRGDWEVETLGDTGRAFKQRYASTPATAVTALADSTDGDRQSVWYDCINYRTNWYREGSLLGLRDIFLFDENYAERYLHTPSVGNCAKYDNLPVMDGYCWGGKGIRAFARLAYKDGRELQSAEIKFVSGKNGEELHLQMRADGREVLCVCRPDGMLLTLPPELCLRVSYASTGNTELNITSGGVDYCHNGREYRLSVSGELREGQNGFTVLPHDREISLSFVRAKQQGVKNAAH